MFVLQIISQVLLYFIREIDRSVSTPSSQKERSWAFWVFCLFLVFNIQKSDILFAVSATNSVAEMLDWLGP